MERYNPDYKIGLNEEQIKERILNNLVNFNDVPPTKTIKQIIISNFCTYFNFLNLLLGGMILGAGIYGHQIIDGLKNCLFMGVILANSVISTIQEVISKKIIDKLSVLSESKVLSIREGKEVLLKVDEILLDDCLLYKMGNQVVVDSIILNGTVEVNESFITGESKSIVKKTGDMLLSGSFISSGACYAKVEHIGSDNYIAKISKEAKYEKKADSVIMNSFEGLLKVLSIVIIPVGILLLYNQLEVTNYDITASIFNTVGALIGMIPEGLLLLTSSVMAVSVARLAKYNVLVQQLYCIETLARVDVICLDKTGTITSGEMDIHKIVAIKEDKNSIDEVLSNFCYAFKSINDTMNSLRSKYPHKGSWEVESVTEFSSSRKYSAVKFKDRGLFYLGAPEFVLKNKTKEYSHILDEYSDYRVLVLARRIDTSNDLEVLGFIILADTIRKEAPDTLKYFKDQGVNVKIISGDNFKTVTSIARRAGLVDANGVDARTLNIDNIDEAVKKYDVFGRVTPEQKKMIITALQRQGHTVAMTGDGVNDVLALKCADCGVAMASGTDAAKNVSQLVLLDSNFASLPEVVEEGRRTINNVERSASLLLIKTIFTSILVCVCILTKVKYFYLPIQLSLITTCTISVPSFFLALEPNHNLVKGNLMLKVVSKSIPPALTVVFNVIMITLFSKAFNIDSNLTSTLIVIMTGTTGFINLSRISRPFNVYRTILYTILLGLYIYILFFHSSFFYLSQINFNTILLYIVFYICSIWVFDKLNLIINYILKTFDKSYEG